MRFAMNRVKEFFGAYWHYLKSPKGYWDLLDYGGFLLVFLVFTGIVVWGAYKLGLM